jgi:hypothetical protein
VVLAFLTKGSWTYSKRTNTYPMGIDFDMTVYKPNGTTQGSSAMRYNAFDIMTFTPSVSGTYRIRVALSRNTDTSNKLNLGVGAGWR